ncbi:hypothetical protein ACP3T3_11440 [Chryseobacterium sp. CBSDS_008]|uniref:hypothetical protein n=1 Tax=Chryseobacterium sp. CBSDS_008 TaxID=3415265 RepID=UPI003CF6A26D
MKKTKTDFQSRLGKGRKKHCGLQLLETYFQFNDLTASKKQLNNIMNYALKRNSRIQEDPSVILHFYQAMRTFIRAGYFIAMKEKKEIVNIPLEEVSPLVLGLLSEKEYQNPLLVFKKAFKEYSMQEFDYFISGMAYFTWRIQQSPGKEYDKPIHPSDQNAGCSVPRY